MGRRPDRAVLPAGAGLGPRPVAGRKNRARRLCGPERPSLPVDRALAGGEGGIATRTGVDGRHQALGRSQPAALARTAQFEPELCILPRTTGIERGPDWCAGSASERRPQHRCRSAPCPAGGTGVPVYDPSAERNTAATPRPRARHGRRHQGGRACRLFLGLRRRGRPRSGQDAPARQHVVLLPNGVNPAAPR